MLTLNIRISSNDHQNVYRNLKRREYLSMMYIYIQQILLCREKKISFNITIFRNFVQLFWFLSKHTIIKVIKVLEQSILCHVLCPVLGKRKRTKYFYIKFKFRPLIWCAVELHAIHWTEDDGLSLKVLSVLHILHHFFMVVIFRP